MRGDLCLATGPDGETCIFGQGHKLDYHRDPDGKHWRGLHPAEVRVRLQVGHLDAATVGVLHVDPGQPTVRQLGRLLAAVSRQMLAGQVSEREDLDAPTEVEDLRREVSHARGSAASMAEQVIQRDGRLAEARAELEHLRTLVAEVLNVAFGEWPCPNPDDPTGCYCPGDEHVDVARVRREAGLS
jgi:hypothetical protein